MAFGTWVVVLSLVGLDPETHKIGKQELVWNNPHGTLTYQSEDACSKQIREAVEAASRDFTDSDDPRPGVAGRCSLIEKLSPVLRDNVQRYLKMFGDDPPQSSSAHDI